MKSSTPLLAYDVPANIMPRAALTRLEETEIDLRLFVPVLDAPQFEVTSAGRQHVEGDHGVALNLRVRNFQVGQHVFPIGASAERIPALNANTPLDLLETAPFLPDHLPLRLIPQQGMDGPDTPTPPEFYVIPDTNEATTVFAPDNRRVYCDTSYPWGAVGRVDTPVGIGSGVMVGPRHLLTASHLIYWKRNGTTDWLRFRPAYYNGSTPFGDAWGTHVLFKYQVRTPIIDEIEGRYDYAVVVLDRRMGDLTGWMGSRAYTDEWDNKPFWSHIGYPGHTTGSNRPTLQTGIALDGLSWQEDSHQAMTHRGDVWPSQSGGPFFGWWAGEQGPRVVAVQSSRNPRANSASGGLEMVHLIVKALQEHP